LHVSADTAILNQMHGKERRAGPQLNREIEFENTGKQQ